MQNYIKYFKESQPFIKSLCLNIQQCCYDQRNSLINDKSQLLSIWSLSNAHRSYFFVETHLYVQVYSDKLQQRNKLTLCNCIAI